MQTKFPFPSTSAEMLQNIENAFDVIWRKVQVSILNIESCIKLRAQGIMNEIVNVKV